MATRSYPEPKNEIHVLHIDDQMDQLRFTKMFLESSDDGLKVEDTTSVEEAMNMLKRHRYDCVVADYHMPDVDGIELARRIRESHKVPLIMYTAWGSDEVAEDAFAVGVDDYIRKELEPSHYQILARRIRMMVEKHRVEELYRRVSSTMDRALTHSLQVIKNATASMRNEPDKAMDMLQTIDDAIDHAAQILDEIRYLTGITSE
jgi:PleD family two-component response regulator